MILKCTELVKGWLPLKYGIDTEHGEDVLWGIPQRSFPLEWEDVPAGTKSFALIVEDYDNIEDEGVHWIHWLVCDMKKEKRALLENESLENPELVQGRTGWALPYGPYEGIPKELICRYGGPAPGRRHEYECTLLALDCTLGFKKGFTYNQLRKKAEGHTIEKAVIKFYYGGNPLPERQSCKLCYSRFPTNN